MSCRVNWIKHTSIAEPAIAPGVIYRIPYFWAMLYALGFDNMPFFNPLAIVGPRMIAAKTWATTSQSESGAHEADESHRTHPHESGIQKGSLDIITTAVIFVENFHVDAWVWTKPLIINNPSNAPTELFLSCLSTKQIRFQCIKESSALVTEASRCIWALRIHASHKLL